MRARFASRTHLTDRYGRRSRETVYRETAVLAHTIENRTDASQSTMNEAYHHWLDANPIFMVCWLDFNVARISQRLEKTPPDNKAVRDLWMGTRGPPWNEPYRSRTVHHKFRLCLQPGLPACPLKSLPAGLQFPPQLADPCSGDSELSRCLTGSIAQRKVSATRRFRWESERSQAATSIRAAAISAGVA